MLRLLPVDAATAASRSSWGRSRETGCIGRKPRRRPSTAGELGAADPVRQGAVQEALGGGVTHPLRLRTFEIQLVAADLVSPGEQRLASQAVRGAAGSVGMAVDVACAGANGAVPSLPLMRVLSHFGIAYLPGLVVGYSRKVTSPSRFSSRASR